MDLFFNCFVMYFGLDFKVFYGVWVFVVVLGMVVFVVWKGGYGKMVEICYVNGFVICYVYFSCFQVKEGDYVIVGDLIGNIGLIG